MFICEAMKEFHVITSSLNKFLNISVWMWLNYYTTSVETYVRLLLNATVFTYYCKCFFDINIFEYCNYIASSLLVILHLLFSPRLEPGLGLLGCRIN